MVNKLKIRKERKEKIGKRTTIGRLLVVFGFAFIFLIIGFISLLSPIEESRSNLLIVFGIGITFLIIYIYLLVKYNKNRTEEQKANRIKVKEMIGPLILLFLIAGAMVYGFAFFFRIPSKVVGATPGQLGDYFSSLVILIVFYVALLPFILALWYKTSPSIAIRFLMGIHGLFNRRSKKKAVKVMVIEVPQKTSFIVTFKRAFTAMTFSLFTTYTIWLPIFQWFNPGLKMVIPAIDINTPFFLEYCKVYLLHNGLPLILSFVIWYWVLPPAWLLDDAGVVFYRRHLKRRQPAEVKTISSWFLNLVQAIVGTSGIITYLTNIWNSRGGLLFITSQSLANGIQFGIFVIGFPFLGTLLLGFILLLFQESQLNKLKTFVYQGMATVTKDPRIVEIGLFQTDKFQDKTLLDYYGENFFHHPPLSDIFSEFENVGEINDEELLKKKKR